MKKLLLSVLIILLIVFIYIIGFKGIKIGSFRINSIYDIKSNSKKLDEDLTKATEMTAKNYPEEKNKLEMATTKLTTIKDKYNAKISSISEITNMEYMQIEKYEKEFLWTTIGNYATKENIELTLEILEGKNKENYDLKFTIIGKYSGIADFIYSIENNDELNFKIEKFVINPYALLETRVITKYSDDSGPIKNETKDNPYVYSIETVISGGDKSTSTTTTNTTGNTKENTTTNNNTNSNNSSKSITYDPDRVQATFTVTGININMN